MPLIWLLVALVLLWVYGLVYYGYAQIAVMCVGAIAAFGALFMVVTATLEAMRDSKAKREKSLQPPAAPKDEPITQVQPEPELSKEDAELAALRKLAGLN